ncbi:MAG: class I SAM-dependent methyltransferase [Herpetosiphonaceae bacterium]|nr:class I SAM-dependent methyltransferase [Herpetosiphonaceae bacterium]
MSVLPPPEQKPAYVNRMFGAIAGNYDSVNRLMTFGLDQGWRRFAVRQVTPKRSTGALAVLDVATGTGDFLPILRRAMPQATVIGSDFCLPMLQAGRKRAGTVGGYVTGDALSLPFPDEAFDAVTTGFAMRNVADIETALQEMWRVTKPGGRMACLEVAQPRQPLVRWGHQLYFNHMVPQLGRLISGDAEAYTYLPQSAARFPAPDVLANYLRRAGWHEVRYTLLGLGAVAVHVGEK